MSKMLVSRRGARLSPLLGVLIMAAVMSAFSSAVAPPRGDNLPKDSESAQVARVLAEFPRATTTPVVLVATGSDSAALTPVELSRFNEVGHSLNPGASPALVSKDQAAAVISLPMANTDNTAKLKSQIETLREQLANQDLGGLKVQVTGGPAFAADIASSFDRANLKLLLTTVGIVAVLLLLTYRSPTLWLVPLVVVALADQVAASITKQLAQTFSLHFDAGIVSVLVFGAGTNYAMLLISRYREELDADSDHRQALARAWRGSLPAILASNVTIVLALSTLLIASLPQTRDLGIASAAGLLVALAATLFVLPPALAVCGPRLFWPFIPRPGHDHDSTKGAWGRIARGVVRRPTLILSLGVLVLGLLAGTLVNLRVGLSQQDAFRVPSQSAAGLKTLTAHFPAGMSEPLDVVGPSSKSEALDRAIRTTPGVAEVRLVGTHQGTSHWSVVTTSVPGTASATNGVATLRDNIAVIDHHALVGGTMAQEVDVRKAASEDFWLIAPMVLLVSLVILILLLQSVITPIALLLVNTASAAAAIGIGAMVSERVLGAPALDSQLPLIAFLFLVALGVDYTMFLSHRIKAESVSHGSTEGTIRGLATTGTVITSAGVVLAGVFAALATLPLMILGQLGIIVGLGVLLDTLVVRTLVVPALFAVLGRRNLPTPTLETTEERVELPA